MQSKWLDVGTTLAAYHLQSKAYEKIMPPSFGDHPEINNFVLERERTRDECFERLKSTNKSHSSKNISKFSIFLKKEKMKKKKAFENETDFTQNDKSTSPHTIPHPKTRLLRVCSPSMIPQNETTRIECSSLISSDEFYATLPSPFLQEASHLLSLLSAVALSTLRSEIDDAETPFIEFIPGKQFPTFNSDDDPNMQQYGLPKSRFRRLLGHIFDVSWKKEDREKYDVARPFTVIGGVSDAEALLLQSARGPTAKVSLVNMWLNEFIIREHLHGSTGSVGSPIISRLQQYQSDGFLWYNSARKISYIPFPFPHSQTTILFVTTTTVVVPLLMLSFTQFWFGFAFNFLALWLFVSINEIAKELEHPFHNVPNDLPLNLCQALFNEALTTMFVGYHPDAWWEINGDA